MLKFTYKLTLPERVAVVCSRHPRYNSEKDGRSGVKGGSTCYDLYDLYSARLKLDAAVREFTRRVASWARIKERHRPKQTLTDEGAKVLTVLVN